MYQGKKKGVEGLIEIENPNRIVKKEKKLSKLGMGEPATEEAKPELSRREREEVEKQRAKAHYQKLHAEGKTEQARADLARFLNIRSIKFKTLHFDPSSSHIMYLLRILADWQ